MGVDIKNVEEKIKKGEALTPEETKEVMSLPPEGTASPEDEDAFKDILPEEEAEKKEETSDKDKKAEPPKAEEPPKPEPKHKKGEEITMAKIEEQLDKPDGNEDLSTFSDAEKGLFWELRRERRKRQKAEEERDALRFSELKRKAEQDIKDKEPKEDKDQIEGEDDEFITKGEMKKLLKGKEKDKGADINAAKGDIFQQRYLQSCDKEAASQLPDYAEVIECADEIIGSDEAYQRAVAKAIVDGDNPAVVMYNLIKGDPKFEKVIPIARARLKAAGKLPAAAPSDTAKDKKAEEDIKKAEKKIDDNLNKPKTSGHHAGGGEADTELTMEQVLKMSDVEFARLPKAKREALLKKFGA